MPRSRAIRSKIRRPWARKSYGPRPRENQCGPPARRWEPCRRPVPRRDGKGCPVPGPSDLKSGALGPVNLMARDREKINVVRLHVDGNLAVGLYRVGMEKDAPFPGHPI